MEIKQAVFVTSIGQLSQMKDFGKPEIAIAGKSNVGKSSFINFIANNKSLAKTSSTPGRTRLINYFELNKSFMLVDLPGYGFAKVGGEDKDSWDKLIGSYLTTSLELAGVALLVDIRHDPSPLDLHMAGYLEHYGKPYFIIATKSDKLSRAQMNKQLDTISKAFNKDKSEIVPTSSLNKTGKELVLEKIETLINNFNKNREI